MKKVLLSVFFLFALIACQAQLQTIVTTKPGADNMKSGGNKINANFNYVDSRIDTIVTMVNDTSDLLTEISALNYVKLPVLTETQINAISSPVNGMFVFNSTAGKLMYYSTGSWRTLQLEQ